VCVWEGVGVGEGGGRKCMFVTSSESNSKSAEIAACSNYVCAHKKHACKHICTHIHTHMLYTHTHTNSVHKSTRANMYAHKQTTDEVANT